MDSDVDCAAALQIAERLAREAGDLVLRGFRTGGAIDLKGRIDLVTEYDLKSEQLVRAGLAEAFPGHRIVGEEQAESGEGNHVWYVDPIDGTTNFAHGHPFFCVSIALYEGSRGLAGVVHAPALGTCWTAAAGSGAHRNGEPCTVSTRDEMEEALCATGFPYDRWTNPDNNEREFSFFLKRTRGVRRCGSAALDLALLADGTYDIYWEQSLQAWDMCAGALLVTEAGGQLSDYAGKAADPRTGRLVASNGLLHEQALRTLAEAREGLVLDNR